MKRKPTLVLACLALGACAPHSLYVRAERSIYEAIAPEYRSYVSNDELLSPSLKALKLQTLEDWRAMIEAAEKSQSPTPVTR